MTHPTSEINPYKPTEVTVDKAPNTVKRIGEFLKATVVLALMAIIIVWLRYKLKTYGVTYDKVMEGIQNLPVSHIIAAVLLTALNYFVLTGYDWIAVRHLKKSLSWPRIMIGAIVGYASGNVLGWLFGGNAAHYRMYSTWGFSLVEIIAFISILSVTFWLGLFLLAGIAFLFLPVHIPEDAMEYLVVEPNVLGMIFLGCIGAYLLACILIRRPIRFRDFEITLPPFQLSAMQLVVSAGDFFLASTVLYSLLPAEVVGPGKINFSTVLIAYIIAQIGAVITHVPGGYGILEVVLLMFLPEKDAVMAAVILFRVIYYFMPAIVAGGLFMWNEFTIKSHAPPDQAAEI